MRHEIINGDVLDGLRSLPDCSVQCVVTSPPYWGLRDYGVPGQIGVEPVLDEYIGRIVESFREVRRVLRDDGTAWLNLGDCYATSNRRSPGLKNKDLVGMPWRVALALQADEWYLRSDVVWNKPNAMSEAAHDRPTKSHEFVFLLSKREKYFYDDEAVREPGVVAGSWRGRRTVWSISTRSFPGAHFATFPPALVEPCILAGTSERGCCPECGAPWERIVEARRIRRDELSPTDPRYRPNRYSGAYAGINGKGDAGYRVSKTVGWRPTCECDAGDPIPCVVLDPFGGSGTVAKVAQDLGRSSVMIELNPEYVGIMEKRLRCGGQLDSGVGEIHVTSLPLTDEGVA